MSNVRTLSQYDYTIEFIITFEDNDQIIPSFDFSLINGLSVEEIISKQRKINSKKIQSIEISLKSKEKESNNEEELVRMSLSSNSKTINDELGLALKDNNNPAAEQFKNLYVGENSTYSNNGKLRVLQQPKELKVKFVEYGQAG